MAKLILPVILLLCPFIAAAEPASVVSPAKHPCAAGVSFVLAATTEYPDWQIVVVCSRSAYEQYEKMWGAWANRGAFTVLAAKRTFILFDMQRPGPERLGLTVDLLAHELKHIRCMCTLGEK